MARIGSAHPIKIVVLTITRDVTGFAKTVELPVWAGWAQVREASGYREYQNGQALLGHVKEFKIRYNPALSPDVNTRVIYSGKRYTVTSIEPDREKTFYWNIRATAETSS